MGKLILFLLVGTLTLFVGPVILMLLWNSTAHEIVPGMIAKGWVAEKIGLWTALKLVLFIIILRLGLRSLIRVKFRSWETP